MLLTPLCAVLRRSVTGRLAWPHHEHASTCALRRQATCALRRRPAPLAHGWAGPSRAPREPCRAPALAPEPSLSSSLAESSSSSSILESRTCLRRCMSRRVCWCLSVSMVISSAVKPQRRSRIMMMDSSETSHMPKKCPSTAYQCMMENPASSKQDSRTFRVLSRIVTVSHSCSMKMRMTSLIAMNFKMVFQECSRSRVER
mmetsp:Transcript_89884/g.232109  ORF Transcript_89884/g.232109 Transcript_89884/m.232109 type:complete len:201 (-) Transcript_89884:767-1369(-)